MSVPQLDASRYTSATYHEAEMAAIYRSGWTAVGFASELASSGAVVSREVAGRPLVITRDRKGIVHVFDNVCRHRGHLLIDEPCARRNLLVCPYHAWSYGLDGVLVKTPYWDGTRDSGPSDAERKNMSLAELESVIWFDLIFARFANEETDFRMRVEELDRRWTATCDPTLLRHFSRRSFSMAGNWKLVAENFLDNYHLPWIHPQVGESIEGALGIDAQNLRFGDNAIGFSLPGSGNQKKKTSKPLPFWPGMNADQRLRQDLFFLLPNVCLVLEGNYLWSMILLPTSASGCDEIVSLYVVGDEAMTNPHAVSRDELAESIYEINGQDNEVIRNLQAGRQSEAASRGVFIGFHDQLGIWFQERIARSVVGP